MSNKRYNIVLEGRILDGHNIDAVKRKVSRLLKADPGRIDRLFANSPAVIKQDIDYPTASLYKEALRQAGAACRIEPMRDPAAETGPPPLPDEDSAQPDQLDWGLQSPPQPDARQLKPAAGWYGVSVGLFLLPMIIAGIVMTYGIVSRLSSGIHIPAPGDTRLTIEHADTYVLWYEPRAMGLERLGPGDYRISLYDRLRKRSISLLPAGLESTETTNGVERKALGRFEIDRPGEYRLRVEGAFRPTTFLLRRSFLSDWQTVFLFPILLGMAGCVIGPLSAIYIFVKRSRHQRHLFPQTVTESEERKWAMFSHIGTFAAFFVPFGNLIAPLIIWQIKKEESDFIVYHSKESLNFQISMFLYSIAAALLIIVLIGFFLLLAIGIFDIILVIMAGIRANDGHLYRYPFTIRFIK